MKKEEVETFTSALKELGLTREEAIRLVNDAVNDSRSIENLSKKRDNSLLIKVGLLLLAFPDPTISDLAGTLLISAGLIQKKIKRSALHMEDVPATFQDIMKNLQTIKR